MHEYVACRFLSPLITVHEPQKKKQKKKKTVLTVDVLDVSGEHQTDIEHTVFKSRLRNGVVVSPNKLTGIRLAPEVMRF